MPALVTRPGNSTRCTPALEAGCFRRWPAPRWLAASALTRFGIFEAGMASARDPKYTIVPQRRRLDFRG